MKISAILVLITVLIAGCAQNQNQDAYATTSVPIATTSAAESTTTAAESTTTAEVVKEIRMTAKQWEWVPSAVSVKSGQKIKLVVVSEDVTHGISIPTLGVPNIVLPKGMPQTIEFTAPVVSQIESHRFYCTVPCGSGHQGMTGTIIVEP